MSSSGAGRIERAVLHRYDLKQRKWKKTSGKVCLETNPFDQGTYIACLEACEAAVVDGMVIIHLQCPLLSDLNGNDLAFSFETFRTVYQDNEWMLKLCILNLYIRI